MQIKEDFKNLIPPLTAEEYKQLEENILRDGCRDPLVIWRNGQDWLIDGHNRFEICQKYDLSFKTEIKEFANENDAKSWIIINQFGRRNLSPYNRSTLALKLEEIFRSKAKENQKQSLGAGIKGSQKSANLITPIDTRQELAKIAGVSHDTINRVRTIEQAAPEAIKQRLHSGQMSINEAYKEIKKVERKADIEEQRREIEAVAKSDTLTGEYDVLVVDPPWNYGREYDPDGSRVANPYPEMAHEQLLDLQLPGKEDPVLFLWTTHQFLFNAKELLDKWGFTYKATMVWDKEKMGMGTWLRMQCEFCLIGIKGKPFWDNTTYRDILREPRREHSRKPEAFYDMVDKICAGRKLDYFSRSIREGWDAYGNQTDKF